MLPIPCREHTFTFRCRSNLTPLILKEVYFERMTSGATHNDNTCVFINVEPNNVTDHSLINPERFVPEVQYRPWTQTCTLDIDISRRIAVSYCTIVRTFVDYLTCCISLLPMGNSSVCEVTGNFDFVPHLVAVIDVIQPSSSCGSSEIRRTGRITPDSIPYSKYMDLLCRCHQRPLRLNK